MIRISKWNETFENAKTRKLMHLEWFHSPAGVDSAGYLELMGRGVEGIQAFAVFTAICQWSATCRPPIRGSCARSDGKPLNDRQIAMILRMPVDIVRHSITVLLSPEVGWLTEDNSENTNVSTQSATDLPRGCQISATDLPIVPVQGEERRGLERNTYIPGNEVVIPNAVNTPECHEAARKWFRHMDESGHPERVPIQNSQAEEDFWREAYKMGHDGFIDAVQYSIGKVSWLSIQERPKAKSGTNGHQKKNGHSKYSKDLINAIKVCQSHPGGDKWQEREKLLGSEVTKALKAAGGSTMLVEVSANDFKLQTFADVFESHLSDIRKASNGTTSSH